MNWPGKREVTGWQIAPVTRPCWTASARGRFRTCLELLLINPAATRASRRDRLRVNPFSKDPDHQYVRHTLHLTDGTTTTTSGGLPDYLRLWRFERYYRLSADQLPRVLRREALDAGLDVHCELIDTI